MTSSRAKGQSGKDGDVRRIGEVEITHNDVIGLEDDWEFLPYEDVDSEDEGINKRLEEDGPPTVSPETLAELDAQAALDEVAKLYEMHVIAPEEIDVRTIPSHKLVDTIIASDWRYRENKWRRRCRIVAREFKSRQHRREQLCTNHNLWCSSYSPGPQYGFQLDAHWN